MNNADTPTGQAVPQYINDGISAENPLRNVPYWGGVDGKNINLIYCLEWAQAFLVLMNEQLPCHENADTLFHINMALREQRDRIQRRKNQGLLGTNKPHEYEELKPNYGEPA